jgi:hypothetical protein
MKKIIEQILEFNEGIISARNIKELNDIYNKIEYSLINNITANILTNMIKLKSENIIFKNSDDKG